MADLTYLFDGSAGFFSFNKDVGHLVSKASIYNDALLIERAAFLLRHEMLKLKSRFEGHFQKDYDENCVPKQLLHFF